MINNDKAITHTSSGISTTGDSNSWSFDWTAPASGTGDVTFYGAFNAANGDEIISGLAECFNLPDARIKWKLAGKKDATNLPANSA